MTPLQYLQSYDNYFWQWEDLGNAIAIPNAYTITFNEYMIEVLTDLAPQGLPPFGSVLLAMIATNPNGSLAIDAIYSLLKTSLNQADNLDLTEAIVFLKLLSEVPSELIQGKKRILLLQSIFKDSHNRINITNFSALTNTLKQKSSEFFNKKAPFQLSVFHKEFQVIALLNRKFSTVSAIVNSISNFPSIPENLPDLEQEEKENTENIIDQLINNKQTFPIGSLIKRLWASINIPFHHNTPSQQTFGGIADITNKGDFDKLLISEFANDSDVFLSRLANNESLFYNREIPPSKNNLQRIILIDTSLKNWGTIKTISFAIAIAIANHPKSKISCVPFVIGDSYKPIAIDSVKEIIGSLSYLETNLHSALGLKKILNEITLKNKEIIFISNQESLVYSEMEKVISEFQNPIDYWIQPTIDGQVSIYKKQNKSKKHLQTISIPIGEIWRRNPIQESEIVEQTSYPILFHEQFAFKKAIFSEHFGLFKVTKEKALFRLHDKNLQKNLKGWELYYKNLNYFYDEYAMGPNASRELVLLMFSSKFNEVVLFNINTGDKKKIPFDFSQNSPYKKIYFDNNLFYFLHSNFYITIDCDGKLNKYEGVTKYLIKTYNETSQVLKRELNESPGKTPIFKNIRMVFINQDSELVFNVHRLFLDPNNIIRINTTKSLKMAFNSQKTGDSTYTFADGSQIELNRSGMIILKSKNSNIPYIFIPSIIERPLGVATKEFFAGNEYFCKSQKYTVILNDISNKKIEIIKAIQSHLRIGLLEVNKQVNICPYHISSDFTKEKAFQLKSELEALGAKVTVNLIHHNQSMIDNKDFFQKYINPFIENIINHGA